MPPSSSYRNAQQPQWLIIQGRALGLVFSAWGLALVGASGLFGVQQPQPFGCLRLCAYSSTVCGALALRSLAAMARRWLPDMVARLGSLRITRALAPPHQGQLQGWSRSAIGRSWVKSPQSVQSYS